MATVRIRFSGDKNFEISGPRPMIVRAGLAIAWAGLVDGTRLSTTRDRGPRCEHVHEWERYPEFSNQWLEICVTCGAQRNTPEAER